MFIIGCQLSSLINYNTFHIGGPDQEPLDQLDFS